MGCEGRGTTFKADTVAAGLLVPVALVLVETLLDLTNTQLLSMAPRSRVFCGHTTVNCFNRQAKLDKGRQGVFGPLVRAWRGDRHHQAYSPTEMS